MEPPVTDKDYAQLLLNLLRGRTPLHYPEWRHLDDWATKILSDDDGGTQAYHGRLWKRHVQMLRAKHPPHIVEQLIEAVKQHDAAEQSREEKK